MIQPKSLAIAALSAPVVPPPPVPQIPSVVSEVPPPESSMAVLSSSPQVPSVDFVHPMRSLSPVFI